MEGTKVVKLTELLYPFSPPHPSYFQVKFDVPKAPITLPSFLRKRVISLPGNHHSGYSMRSLFNVCFCILRKKILLEMKDWLTLNSLSFFCSSWILPVWIKKTKTFGWWCYPTKKKRKEKANGDYDLILPEVSRELL